MSNTQAGALGLHANSGMMDTWLRPPSFHDEVRDLLRDRILDSARDLVVERGGWSAVNMSRVAREVGISRTTLYNEVGTRDQLAASLIAREADRFLHGGVVEGIADEQDIVDGLTAAAERTLTLGEDNELLMSIISGRLQGGELLSLVTVDSEVVLGRATQVVADQIRSRKPDLDEFALESITEIFVRLTVSHLLQLRGVRVPNPSCRSTLSFSPCSQARQLPRRDDAWTEQAKPSALRTLIPIFGNRLCSQVASAIPRERWPHAGWCVSPGQFVERRLRAPEPETTATSGGVPPMSASFRSK